MRGPTLSTRVSVLTLLLPFSLAMKCQPPSGPGGSSGAAGSAGARDGGTDAAAGGGRTGSGGAAGAGGLKGGGAGGFAGTSSLGGGPSTTGAGGSTAGSAAGAAGSAAGAAGNIAGVGGSAAGAAGSAAGIGGGGTSGGGASGGVGPGGGGAGGGAAGSGDAGSCPGASPNAVWGPVFQDPGNIKALWSTGLNDLWIVDSPESSGPGSPKVNAVEHWNGTTLTPVLSSPTESYGSIWASGPDDVWVGGTSLHRWDGTAWTDMTPPGATSSVIGPAWGFGPDDVWATSPTSVFHWDGTSWTTTVWPTFPAPAGAPAEQGPFAAGAGWGASPDDVWLCGEIIYKMFPDGGGQTGATVNAFAHWDGEVWTVTPPDTVADAIFNLPRSIWGSATNDIWAVGPTGTTSGIAQALHFDGTSWSIAPQVSVPGAFTAVWGACASDVWIVGTTFTAINSVANPLVQHFDGSTWSTIVTPFANSPQRPAPLAAITGTSANDVWIGGGTTVIPGVAFHLH
jgi:hypothetical protein